MKFQPSLLPALLALFAAVLVSGGCESIGRPDPLSEFESLQDASDAYLAYERGDCQTVLQLTQFATLEFWEENELRHSMYLVHGFCQEIEGNTRRARQAYERVLAAAPSSFSGLDAQERLRQIRLQEADPNHAETLAEARIRALADTADRQPIVREKAAFPPVPRAAGIEGYALVEFGVTPRGETSDPIVIESSPRFIFDGTALRAVREWEYARKPGAQKADRQVIRLSFISDNPNQQPPADPASAFSE